MILRYDNGTFFPCREDANYDRVGEGRGEGFNVNIPWNGSGMGDPEYTCALFNVILPVAYQFDPDLVLVSAGFDAARGDPLGFCKVGGVVNEYAVCSYSGRDEYPGWAHTTRTIFDNNCTVPGLGKKYLRYFRASNLVQFVSIQV